MSVPVTTLTDIITLAHQQYGIRFQLTQQQLVDFANMIQMIAYNNDLSAFVTWDQTLRLGHDVFLETDPSSYVSPVASDIGKSVQAAETGIIGTLRNYKTQNRIHRWIIEPPDGGTTNWPPASEPLNVVGGTGEGDSVVGQDFYVSLGPYPVPRAADGYPPFRKFIGITELSDEELFNLPPGSNYSGYDDYGIYLNGMPNSRHQFYPHRFDVRNMEVVLKTSTRPSIEQTTENYGPGGTTLNTSKLRWVYYWNPPTIESINDGSNLILPEQYRYEILFMGISRLADTATYGDAGSVREIIAPLCERFWEDMRTQYQAMGSSSDWISDGDLPPQYSRGWGLGRRIVR